MIKDILQQGDWMYSLDFKDTYLTVPIAKEYCFCRMAEYSNLLAFPLGSAMPHEFSQNSHVQ